MFRLTALASAALVAPTGLSSPLVSTQNILIPGVGERELGEGLCWKTTERREKGEETEEAQPT